MNENLFETTYDVTKKSKFRYFYNKYKLLLISSLSALIIIFIIVFFYTQQQHDKKVKLSENYIDAKIYLSNGDLVSATNILKEIVLSNDRTYSTLSLFLLLDENLIKEKKDLSNLFDHLLNNNKFNQEFKNLIIFKRLLLQSNYANEFEILESAKKLLDSDTVWRAHTLSLLGDYFFSKNEKSKAKDFYTQILLLKNISREFIEHAQYQLSVIENE
tara:strand:+ start:165 stop:812 length:648 start_codon:yes stop_codon:yes gene_type:complete